MADQPQLFYITRPIAQAILDYLTDRPYKEVVGLVQQLQRLPAAELPSPKNTSDEKGSKATGKSADGEEAVGDGGAGADVKKLKSG